MIHRNFFEEIISTQNLFLAWREFHWGKRKKWEVQQFELRLEDNLFRLHDDLRTGNYRHGYYRAFYVSDPKLRHIHKADVLDRVMHQAVFRVLYPIFDKSFIFDSYSCRLEKGTHRAVDRLEHFARKQSVNYRKEIFALKCDVRKFFDSIDQNILLNLIEKKIDDLDCSNLIKKILFSFEVSSRIGLPLGNVTSQLFANIYLNELDQFIKRKLKARFYIRYCDDFVILSDDRNYLENLIEEINNFLQSKLKLKLHQDKILIQKYHRGIDFLGYVVFPDHRILRTKTKRRMFRKIREKKELWDNLEIDDESFNQSIQSYLGVLAHCSSKKIREKLVF